MTVVKLSRATAIEPNDEMDLDLSEYDQVDEVKSMGPTWPDATQSTIMQPNVACLASCPNSTGDDTGCCENDFVFLPAPTRPPAQVDAAPIRTGIKQQQVQVAEDACEMQEIKLAPISEKKDQSNIGFVINQEHPSKSRFSTIGSSFDCKASTNNVIVRSQPISTSTPLSTLNVNNPTIVNNNCSNNPFDMNHNCIQQQQQYFNPIGTPSKPVGLLEISSSINVGGNTNKLDELLHQIVTRSDMIYIAIPCAFCHEPIACPPSDISAWLNHMSRLHNCKACPICNKMIGLGPRRDIDVMRRHVLSHLDEDWLNRRATKTSFTFGLQQQWFSGSRCSVRDVKYRY